MWKHDELREAAPDSPKVLHDGRPWNPLTAAEVVTWVGQKRVLVLDTRRRGPVDAASDSARAGAASPADFGSSQIPYGTISSPTHRAR